MTKAAGSRSSLGDIDASTVNRLVETASDLALVLDPEGTIIGLIGREDDLARRGREEWLGRAWIQTVTPESREKVTALLQDAAAGQGPTRWRQVNHPSRNGDDLPIVYSALDITEPAAAGRKPAARRFLAVGRDLRATVALQRKLVEAQQAMERDYWRFREAETRYRNLLQTSSEAILIVDLQSLKVVEANPAAETLCAGVRARLAGAPLSALFDAAGEPALQALLAAARTIGKRGPGRFTLTDGTPVMLSLSSFRQEEAGFLLARLLPVAAPAARGRARGAALPLVPAPEADPLLRAFVDLAPDGIAFTDLQGRVRTVNRAFASLAELSTEDQARGQMLDRWLGRTGVELQVLIGNLRQRGSAGLFTTTLRGEFGATTEVEIAATVLPPGQGDALAFSVRDVARRLQASEGPPSEVRLPRTVGELNDLVGRVPLKDIVSETTDVIEQMAIETALRMTGDNRASAAQLLGLSRQSLYVKLRRFGIGDLGGETGAGESDATEAAGR